MINIRMALIGTDNYHVLGGSCIVVLYHGDKIAYS